MTFYFEIQPPGRKRRMSLLPLWWLTTLETHPLRHGYRKIFKYCTRSQGWKPLFPKIDVFTRQNFNIKKRIMRNRFNNTRAGEKTENSQMAGNFKFHQKRCMSCDRMENGKNNLLSTKTKREYKLKRHYTCQSIFCIYVLTCEICQAQYTGQTIQTVQKRHYGHISEVKRCE